MSSPLILLVDQSKFFLEIQKGFLKNTDARIVCVGTTRETLDCLRRQPANLVYLTRELPGDDGLHCCQAIKKDPELGHIPVVMLYDAGAPAERERCLKAGSDGVLSRPLERRSFLDEGRKFLFKVERREPRIPCQALVVFRYSGVSSYGTCHDLSPGGIYIASNRRVQIGDRITLSMVLPGGNDQLVEAGGRIAWLNPGPRQLSNYLPAGFGVEFFEFSPGCSLLLQQFLKQPPSSLSLA